MTRYTDAELIIIYGQPGDAKNLITWNMPYPMRVAWDKSVTINKTQCHLLLRDQLHSAFSEVLKVYGMEKIKALGLDLFGGLYNFRKMRGGNQWSRHSWAIAIDIDPERNGLKTSWAKSQLSKPEYKPFMDIMTKNGFINYGKLLNYDSMHFEVGKK